MRPYQYRCNDYSLLTPPFKKWIISPLIRIVPWAIPANIITLISNFFVYLGLFLAIRPQYTGEATPILIAFCLILYLIGDHLDGMQAKRTGTGSALGEFCDHYLDAFNNGIIVYTMFTIFNISNGILISAVLVISYLAHMSVFYEQFKTGWLRFEKIGSLEGVLISAVLIGLSFIPSFYTLMTMRVVADFTLAEIFILCSTAGAFVTFLQTYRRIPDVKNGFWIFAVLWVALGMVIPFALNAFQTFAVLTLYASLYIGQVMTGHLIDGKERQTDFIVPCVLVLHQFTDFPGKEFLYESLLIYLLVRIVILIYRAFTILGVYWVWQNARI